MISKKYLPLVLIFSGVGIVAGIIASQFIKARQPTAGLKIESTPTALVFIDNVQEGSTPFEKLLPPGEITLKIVPEQTSATQAPFQTKVRLTDKIYTVIKREFGADGTSSAGETITLTSSPGKPASLTVVTSDPDSASVFVDGEPQGFTPLTLSTLSPLDHQIEISAPGYASRTINAKAMDNYVLQITAQLLPVSPTPTPLPSPTPKISDATSSATIKTPSPTPAPGSNTVKITSTPTGFLRVRSAPNRNSAEVGRVNPGETYPLLDSVSGWYLIKAELSATSSGWISSEYAQKI